MKRIVLAHAIVIFVVTFFSGCFVAQAQVITTFAGNGSRGYSGDGGAATAAGIGKPCYITFDATGNMYFSDDTNSVVRKVSPSGIITTFAGNGSGGFSGDGGQATAAELASPQGLAVDAAGNLYIADHYNSRIRKVSTSGIITTIAGNGTWSYTGDGGPATAATTKLPVGVCTDRIGNVYFSDENQTVRKIDTSGIIITYAGMGSIGYGGDGGPASAAYLYFPRGIRVDAAGNMYIADYYNQKVRRIDAAGIISTIAGGTSSTSSSGDGGPATAAYTDPWDIALDAAGHFFISDAYYGGIRMVNPAGIINIFAGGMWGSIGFSGDGGPASSAGLFSPVGIEVDQANNVYICDYFNCRIRKVTACNPAVQPILIPDSACATPVFVLSDSTPGGTWTSSDYTKAYFATGGSIASLSGVGTVTISYTVSNGCGSTTVTHPLEILSHIAGNITLASGNYSLCLGTGDIAHSSSIYGPGVWISTDPTVATIDPTGHITPVAAGAVTILYAIHHLCDDTSSMYLIVDSAAADAGTISGKDSVCINKMITLTESVGGGTWSSSNTSVATITYYGTVTGRSNGTAIIRYRNTNACGSNTAVHPVYVRSIAECHVGIDELFSIADYNLSAYPTISSGMFNIILSGPVTTQAQLTVTDIVGRSIKTATINTNGEQSLILDAPPGTYFVSATTPSGRLTQRIILAK